MNITIRGKSPNITNQEARYVLDFYSKILLSPQMSRRVSLVLSFKATDANTVGLCGPIDWDCPGKHREFEMFVEPQVDRNEMLYVFAHEMEHLRQFAYGELVSVHDKWYKWNGELIEITDEIEDKTPWEVQAQLSEPWLRYFYETHLDASPNGRRASFKVPQRPLESRC